MTYDDKNITPYKDLTHPSVLMLMGQQCSYCGPMMQLLIELLKAGKIGDLRIIDIEAQPGVAADLGVRSVPWLQIGLYELRGSRSKAEIESWLQRASSKQGMRDYLSEVLSDGDIELARKLIRRYPPALESIIALMADAEAKINVRLGVGVLIEELANSDGFRKVIPQLVAYLRDDDARIRSDACHYLSLTDDPDMIGYIEPLLDDESAEVREIAQDALEELSGIAD